MIKLNEQLKESDLQVGEILEILDEETNEWVSCKIQAIGIDTNKLIKEEGFLSEMVKGKKATILSSQNNKKETYFIFYEDDVVFKEEDNVRQIFCKIKPNNQLS